MTLEPDRPLRRAPVRAARRASATLPREGLLLFAVALALRIAYAWIAQGPGAVPSSDGISYDELAWNLARGAGFHVSGAGGEYATAFRPPVLPFVVSLLYRMVGHRYFAALLLQCVVGALIAPLLAGFARATFGPGPARFAGWLAALHPMLVFFSAYMLTETLFAFTLLLAIAASAEWVKTPRPGRALGAGLLWGLSILTRPNALALPFVVAAWAWFPLGLTIRARDRARQLALLALGVALVVGPWTLRNARELHAFVPVTTGGGRALLDSNNALIWDDPALRGGALSVYNLEPYATRLRGLGEAQADALAGRMAIEFARSRVPQWPQVALAKLARFWRLSSEAGPLTGRWRRTGTPLDTVVGALDPLLAWSLAVLPLAIWGALATLRGGKRLFLSLPLLVIALFTLSAIVYWGALRMRVPIEPLVALYAAAGLDDLRRRWRVRRGHLTLVEGTRG